MTNNEIRLWLTQWLLNFGSDWVGRERHESVWYQENCTPYNSMDAWGDGFFDIHPEKDQFKLNQTGLDFLKGTDHGD